MLFRNLWLRHFVFNVAWIFGFISTIWEIWIFCVYKHKKRRLFLVLWLRIWFIVWFKSIFTPAATLWIFEKILSWNYFRTNSLDILKLKPLVIWGQSNLKIYNWYYENIQDNMHFNSFLCFILLFIIQYNISQPQSRRPSPSFKIIEF